MAGPKKISTKIKLKYNQEGAVSLIKSIPSGTTSFIFNRYIIPNLSAAIYRSIKDRIITREELREKSDNTGRLKEYSQAQEYQVHYESPETLPTPLQNILGTYYRPQPFVSELYNVVLLWDSALGLDAEGNIILETTENDLSILKSRLDSAISKYGLRQVLSDLQIVAAGDNVCSSEVSPVFPLIRHPSTNFYHWTLEYLPKLRAYEEWVELTNEIPTVLIETNPPEWVTNSLDTMGIPSTALTQWRSNRASLDRFILPLHQSRTPPTPEGPSPQEIKFLRRRISPESIGSDYNSKRIYISRQKAADRRVENREELLNVLSQFGFKSFILEEMSFREQVGLFSEADMIIAPHGAGLTHLAFSIDSNVIELFPKNNIQPHYFYLSMILDINYEYIVGEQKSADMRVPVGKVKNLVQSKI
jgi:hypothetical protein